MIDVLATGAFRCGHPRSPENTGRNGSGRTRCKSCLAAKGAAWHSANRDRVRAAHRRNYLANPDREKARAKAFRLANPDRYRRYSDRARYGVTRDELAQSCEVCGSTAELSIDHDHATGRVRGRLCRPCNQGIGFFRDDPDLIRAALRYLGAS